MALGANELKLAKGLYWILLTIVHLYLCYLLFINDRAIAGIIWLVVGFLILYVMYPVYFPNSAAGSRWPPYVTSCPDYLTMIAPNACADFVGLGSPLLKKSDPALPPSPSDSSHVFNAAGTVAEKAARAQQYGLSWEGIL